MLLLPLALYSKMYTDRASHGYDTCKNENGGLQPEDVGYTSQYEAEPDREPIEEYTLYCQAAALNPVRRAFLQQPLRRYIYEVERDANEERHQQHDRQVGDRAVKCR